jgi:cyanophycin synthetase
MIEAIRADASSAVDFPRSFPEWRHQIVATGAIPIVAVAGSRGKSTVLRMVDAIFRAAGLRTALWTDQGVEIGGRQQSGELGPWSRALERVQVGSIDVALQELDWATVHTVGLPAGAYPVVAVTNLCVNSDSCLVHADTLHALSALRQLRAAARGDGVLVLNGEDFATVGDAAAPSTPRLLVGVSGDTPLIRRHLQTGGTAAWAERDRLLVGSVVDRGEVGTRSRLRAALDGQVGFQVHNALFAAAIARVCGLSSSTIGAALADFTAPPRLMPGSFNVVAADDRTFVVDRPAPSWFLRPALRAVGHLPARRLLTVVGRTEATPSSDLFEAGRLLGRGSGAVILHSEVGAPVRAKLLLHGIAANAVPPVIVHVPTESRAVGRLLRLARPGDLGFILADDPPAVLRALERARGRSVDPSASEEASHLSAGGARAGADQR